MVEKFFFGNKTDTQESLMLISGPPSCGKTSLLFQFAFNSAVESTSRVVFICNRRKLESHPPYLSQGIDPSSDIFKRIQMKYVDDDEGINKYLAAFHLQDSFPAAVVIDDFGDFFGEKRDLPDVIFSEISKRFEVWIDVQPSSLLNYKMWEIMEESCQERHANPRGRDMAIVRTLALCHNAAMHAKKQGTCKLLLSDTQHGDSPRLMFIYKRWIPFIYLVKGNGHGSFILSNNSPGSGKRTAKYSIAFQYLFLEGINEESEQ